VKGRRAASAVVLAAATVLLFVVSRGKWSDAIIDSGREWMVPDALSRGALLYRDVVYWFGPFTPYFQAGFLRLFGSGFGALVLAGAVAGIGVLAALFSTLVRVAGRRDADLWTALAVPALLFMPNAGGALLGMGYRIWQAATFTLAAVALASSGGGRRRGASSAFAAGALAGLAGLCRTEWGLAAILATGLAAVLRARARARGAADALLALGGFALVFGGGLAAFLWLAGPQAVVGDGHLLLTGLPEETRHFLVAFSGVADWRRGMLELLYSGAMWTGVFLLAARLAAPAGVRTRGLEVALAAVLLVLIATALAGGAGGAVIFSAAPAVGLAALAAGLWRGRGSPAAALAASGLLAVLLSYRRPFHIGDSAYVGPPLLFAFVSAAGLLRLAVAHRRLRVSRRLRTAFRWAIAALLLLAFAGRAWQYASLEGVPIAGTSKMLTARPELAREIEQLGSRIRQGTRVGEGLIVFPEGELLNLLSDRPNPIRHKLYLPGYLTDANEADVLRELESARPAAIVLWRRPVPEYGRALFGEDYGKRIRVWIDGNYDLVPFQTTGAPARTNPRFLWGLRKAQP
jgi:hypothetical protein